MPYVNTKNKTEFSYDVKYRTSLCKDLHTKIESEQTVAGWIRTKRDHGGLLFLNLHDHTGLIQCVIDQQHELFLQCDKIPIESVVSISGKITERPTESLNDKLNSGHLELQISKIEILSKANSLPFALHQNDIGEEIRLRYRFLDLRREIMQKHIRLRSEVIHEIRTLMMNHQFLEIHTPILTASSPEGARDYVIPSRIHKGKFYALPQAPQQFKQLLMVSGIYRYFQIAPCFRDEDSRSDRVPGDFYQLDMEMSFATQEDVFNIMENVIHKVFFKFQPNMHIDDYPFKRISYKTAINEYATDKPDLRNPLKLYDITHLFTNDIPKIFESAVQTGKIYALPVPNLHLQTRKFLLDMQTFAQSLQAKGLGYIIFDEKVSGPLTNALSKNIVNHLQTIMKKVNTDMQYDTNKGGVLFIASENLQIVHRVASEVRQKVATELDLIKKNSYMFCWICDFPMYEWSEEKKGWEFSHNPFSMPYEGLQGLNKNPSEILAQQYDLVCNGYELTSGAIRNHSPDIMYKAFEIVGYTKNQVDKEFSGMINAFSYGAPPHGGSASGLERIIMLLAGTKNLREVIPFPLTQSGEDLMLDAPKELSKERQKELGITVTK